MALLAGLFGGASAPTFVEREPWECGFAQLFARDVAPQLAVLETWRRLTLAGIAATLAIDFVVLWFFFVINEDHLSRGEAIVVGAPMGLLTAGCVWLFTQFVRREQRVALPVVCRQFGTLEVDFAPEAPTSSLEPYWALGLIRKQRSGKAVTLKVRDLVTGQHRGIGLRLVEFDAYDSGGRDFQGMFRGTVLELALPDAGPGHSYAPWQFDHATLARMAQEMDGAAALATAIATSAVARALAGMAAAFGTDGLCGAVSGNEIYIAIPRARRGRPLTVTPLWRSVYRCEPAIRAALAELAAVFAAVDAVADACGQPAAAALAAAPVAQTSTVTGADVNHRHRSAEGHDLP